MGLFSPTKTKEEMALDDLKTLATQQQLANQYSAQQMQMQQQLAAQQHPYVNGSGSILYPSSGGSWATTTGTGGINSTYTYGQSSSPASHTPWVSDDEGWGAEEVQAAAGEGWILTEPDDTFTPTLCAWQWGTKSKLSDKELLEDVVTQAVTGNSRIAYKILQILTKNRSPYWEWADTVKVLAAEYEK